MKHLANIGLIVTMCLFLIGNTSFVLVKHICLKDQTSSFSLKGLEAKEGCASSSKQALHKCCLALKKSSKTKENTPEKSKDCCVDELSYFEAKKEAFSVNIASTISLEFIAQFFVNFLFNPYTQGFEPEVVLYDYGSPPGLLHSKDLLFKFSRLLL